MRVFIETYGCTLNQADSEIIRGVLAERNIETCKEEKEADVVVLNTCFVKTQTQQSIIDRLKKLSGKKLVVAGCMPAANREMVEEFSPQASLVGPYSLSRIADAVVAAYGNEKKVFLDIEKDDKFSLPKVRAGVIARIPLSEGCNSCCSFCVTKLARPVLRSYAEDSIIKEVENCVKAGFREIQLTSMDTGAYGIDTKTSLPSLLKKIGRIDCKFLTRVGMINPEHALRMLPELVDAFKSDRVYKFLHLPLQSGDDQVLKDMNRRYSVSGFMQVVGEFRRQLPELTLATDIIVGFPTESEEAFQRTVDVIKELKPDVVNNSKFFPRPGTKAASMKRLPNETVNDRSRVMNSLCKKIGLEKNKKFIGKKFEVLLTEHRGEGMAGRNRNYKQVVVKGGQLGEFISTTIFDSTACYIKGII